MGTERRERQKANRLVRQEELARQGKRRSFARRGIIVGTVLAIAFAAAVLIAVIGGGGDDEQPTTTTAPAAAVATEPSETTD